MEGLLGLEDLVRDGGFDFWGGLGILLVVCLVLVVSAVRWGLIPGSE